MEKDERGYLIVMVAFLTIICIGLWSSDNKIEQCKKKYQGYKVSEIEISEDNCFEILS